MVALLFIYIYPDCPAWVTLILVFGTVTSWLFFYIGFIKKLWFFLSFLLCIIFVWGLLNVTYVQNLIVKKVASTLSDKLNTTVSLKHISYHFFDKLEIVDLLVKDQQKDTLLFAGATRVNITDWFFIKNKATLQYVSLDNATVNLSRTDSVWNYQYLIDFFGSNKSNNSKKGGIEFDLKVVEIQNFQLNQTDGWAGHNMNVSVKKLDLDAENVNINQKQIDINSLVLDEPLFAQFDYDGRRPDSLNVKKPKPVPLVPNKYKWNNEEWVWHVKDIKVINGVFQNDTETDRQPFADRFDGAHLRFGQINGEMKNILFEKDTLTADVVLATKERSGFQVKKLKAKMKFTPEIMEYSELELITNKSRLGNYYAMKYENFSKDMSNFIHAVTLQVNFENSTLDTDDLAYFTPEVKNWNRVFHLKGDARGTIDNLTVKNMLISSENTFVDGDIALRGLPDIEKTFIDFRANDLKTTYTDLAVLFPGLKTVKQPHLEKLGTINYKGNFTGFINDFVAFGTIDTRLGRINGDINLKLPANKPAIYLGKISTVGFKIGQFFNNDNLGAITFSGKVNGSGVTEEDVSANFDGNISSVVFNGYAYQHISLKGDFKKKLFTGVVSVNDPNLKLDYLNGTIDLSKKNPQFAFDANLSIANLSKLKLTQEDYSLSGHFNLNFTGSNIDNFLGTAKISDASLTHFGLPLSFDSLVLQSSVVDDQKFLTLRSNELDADLTGNFKIMDLPEAFKLFLNRYYPAYIEKPTAPVSEQNFSFSIKTKEADAYIQLIDRRLKGFDNATISGNLNLKENELNVNVEVPLFSYDGKEFNDIRLTGHGNLDSLLTNIDVGEIVINDSLRLPASNLVFSSKNDVSDINIKTRASKTFGDAMVNAQVTTLKDGVKIHFFPSSFIINDKKWQLERDGELTLSRSEVSANEVKFVQGMQQIVISTEPSSLYNSNDVLVKLVDVNIDDFLPFAFKQPRLEGEATGNIRIMDPFGKQFIEFNTRIKDFRIDGDSIGVVNGSATYSTVSGLAKFRLDAESKENKFKIDGIFNSKDSTEGQTDISLVSERLNLSILNNYLGSILSDISGVANTADLKIRGNTKHLSLTGTANILDGSVKVIYTQCKYLFTNETIIFNPGEIDFGSIRLKDTLNNTAILSGKLYHRFFQDFVFDNITFETNKLLILNTTKKDNPLFYGKVIGNAKMILNGPVDDMVMNISGEPSTADTSHIYLNSSNSLESGVVDYIDFIQFGTRMENEYKGRLSSNIVVNMNLTANPSCKIDVILDETTGDIIKGEGNGLLKIKVGNREPLSINGRYNISRGEYTFNFQTFLKKYFTVNSGTIVWSGDPLNAQINLVAEYLASNVDFKNISGTTLIQQKGDVKILAHLTETLTKPVIDFEFVLPESNSLKNNFIVVKRLQQFKEDKNELNKQVTSLLLFNSFISSSQSFLNVSSGYNVLSSTIGGVVSNALSGFFNKFLQKYVKNTSVYLDLNTSVGPDLQSNVAKLQAAAKSGFIFTLLNGRLIISAGVNLDYNNPYITTGRNNNLFVTPDITAEWLLTKDGRIRLVGFNRTNYDLVGQRIRTGVSLSYRKDFDQLTQLFTQDEEKKRDKALNKVQESN